jgi:predicted ester cyclase
MVCTAYDTHREKLRSELDRTSFTISKMLTEREAVASLLKFVDATGRLKGEFGKIER